MTTRLQVLWTSCTYSASRRQITYIAGRNPGGSRWELSADAALRAVEMQKLVLFILREGRIHDLIVARDQDAAYLKCITDGPEPTSLLSLPAFMPVKTFLDCCLLA